jgi:CRISPR-associated protein Cas5d
MKVERVSYDVMTPSAARGILEAIFWKPEFQWLVREVWVLNPIRHLSILRNEMTSRQSERSEAARGGHYYADAGKNRAQRHTLALRNVSYIIRAEQRLTPHTIDPLIKYREQFVRRVAKGQCFHRPYLGCSEFSAHFGPLDGSESPITFSDDLGLMLFDMDYKQEPKGNIRVYSHDSNYRGLVKVQVEPIFFQARLENGILHIPSSLYKKGGG